MLTCVMVAVAIGLVKSVMVNQGLKMPSINTGIINLGALQDALQAGLLGYVVYLVSPLDPRITTMIAAFVGGDPKKLMEFIRDWLSRR
ncbi:MAG TPA: hypothetical protein VD902_10105 [Symbiobacteriaceae bacterium]|nr:hypothetical protein [Symbiobacteriaceae bacterium]